MEGYALPNLPVGQQAALSCVALPLDALKTMRSVLVFSAVVGVDAFLVPVRRLPARPLGPVRAEENPFDVGFNSPTPSAKPQAEASWNADASAAYTRANPIPAGTRLRVNGVEMTRQSNDKRFANLKVYENPGDPYCEVLSFLRHGDVIVATGFEAYAGQSWVQHDVDESERGLHKGETPRSPYVGWSPCDLAGHVWLVPADDDEIDEEDDAPPSSSLGAPPLWPRL